MVRNLLVTSLWFWGGWLLFHIMDLNVIGVPPNPRETQWYRLVLIFMYGTALLVALAWALIVFCDNWKLKKRTEGQWYDNQNLSKRDLEQGDSEAGEGDGPKAKG